LDILSVECCFSDPDADLTAKSVKTATFKEILDFARSCNLLSLCPNIADLIDCAERPMFRSRPEVSPFFVPTDENDGPLDPSWVHYAMHYELLGFIIACFPHHTHFDFNYIRLIMSEFAAPDLRERKAISSIVLAIVHSNSSLVQPVLHLCAMFLLDAVDRSRSYFVILPILTVVLAIIRENATTGLPELYVQLYHKRILPLLGCPHFTSFQCQFRELVSVFLAGAPNVTAKPTLDALLKHFPITRPAKSAEFIGLLTMALRRIEWDEIGQSLSSIVLTVTRCASLAHIKTCDATHYFWNCRELEPLLMENSAHLYPIIYPMLDQAAHESWCQALTVSIGEILRTMSRLDPQLFHNLSRHRVCCEVGSRNKPQIWAAIVREAHKEGHPANLSEKFAEIQRVFVGPTRRTQAAETPQLSHNQYMVLDRRAAFSRSKGTMSMSPPPR
jgi:hypothetical protein